MAAPDTIVIGGGFFGCCLAVFLSDCGETVVLLERSEELCGRASFVNQARIHNGYHYPRSFLTAIRSAVNFPRFCNDFPDCVESRFEKVYAIARHQSRVTGSQFFQFCRNIGAEARPAPARVRDLFDPAFVESVYMVTEYAFNALSLRATLAHRMGERNIRVLCGTEVTRVAESAGELVVTTSAGDRLHASNVYNCTYSNVNTILRRSGLAPLPLKHEIAEIALIIPPARLAGLGVTVMDGPFFSTMPFPALSLYSLTHVRYTAHEAWLDERVPREPDENREPYKYLENLRPESRYPYMIRDAQRYLPCMSEARYEMSLYEVKTLLRRNETDDGRPILLERHCFEPGRASNFVTVLGGKIDNVYDILERLNCSPAAPELVTAVPNETTNEIAIGMAV